MLAQLSQRGKNMNQEDQKIKVTSYLDYRRFLSDIYEQKKSVLTNYSYFQFASDLGFSPTNVIRLVIRGKRSLALKSAQKIAKNLGLPASEKKYFLALVGYNDAKGAALKQKKFEDVLHIKNESLAAKKENESLDYFFHWSRPVVREILRVWPLRNKETKNSSKELYLETAAERLRTILYPDLRIPKAKETLDFLIKNDFASLERDGVIAIKDQSSIAKIDDKAAGHLGVLKYHQEMIQMSQECLIKVPADERDFNALTLCVSEQEFEQLKDQIRRLCVKAMEQEASAVTRDRVVQLNIQLFNMTKKLGEDL